MERSSAPPTVTTPPSRPSERASRHSIENHPPSRRSDDDDSVQSSLRESKATRGLQPGGAVPGAFNVLRRARGEVPAWHNQNTDDEHDDFEEYDNNNSTCATREVMVDTSLSTYGQATIDDFSLASVQESKSGPKRCRPRLNVPLCFTLLMGIVIGIFFLIATLRNRSSSPTPRSKQSALLCDFTGKEQPDVHRQCECNNTISVLTEDTLARFELLATLLGDSPDWSSCSPQNIAKMTLATYPGQIYEKELLIHYALIVLYLSLNGSTWLRQDGWKLSHPNIICPCCKYGITCEGDNVLAIQLNSNHLGGTIPAEIGLLTALTSLDLSQNTLITAPLPTELGLLTNLVNFSIHYASVTGPIPTQVGRLTNLRTINIESNALTSSLPSELGLLTSLHFLNCKSNHLNGTFPSELNRLTQLQLLLASNNEVDHSGPGFFWNFTSLRNIDVSACGITGTIPSTGVKGMTSLTELSMGSNRMTGLLPTDLALLTNLEGLNLQRNRFRGPFPATLPTSLYSLQLSQNALTGTVPASYDNLINLVSLALEENEMTGTLSDRLCKLNALTIALTPDCRFAL